MRPKTRKECPHESMERLGTESHAHFYKCRRCEEVVVVQGGHAWRIRPDVVPA